MGKLVRDKIHSLIEQNGQKPLIRVLDRAEYCSCLEAKLDEEVAEFHQSRLPLVLGIRSLLRRTA